MTNEEAKRKVRGYLTDILPSDCSDEIDEIMKALEQEPSEDVLDNIKAEITEKFDNCSICEWFEDYDYDENDISEYISVGHISDIIDIIDKYRK